MSLLSNESDLINDNKIEIINELSDIIFKKKYHEYRYMDRDKFSKLLRTLYNTVVHNKGIEYSLNYENCKKLNDIDYKLISLNLFNYIIKEFIFGLKDFDIKINNIDSLYLTQIFEEDQYTILPSRYIDNVEQFGICVGYDNYTGNFNIGNINQCTITCLSTDDVVELNKKTRLTGITPQSLKIPNTKYGKMVINFSNIQMITQYIGYTLNDYGIFNFNGKPLIEGVIIDAYKNLRGFQIDELELVLDPMLIDDKATMRFGSHYADYLNPYMTDYFAKILRQNNDIKNIKFILK